MKKFILSEKDSRSAEPIQWIISKTDDDFYAALKNSTINNSEGLCLGRLTKITKRGWTITVFWLTNKAIDVFLPRENFEQIDY